MLSFTDLFAIPLLLVQLQGSPSYTVRESATRVLAQSPPQLRHLIHEGYMHSRDAEVRRRCELLWTNQRTMLKAVYYHGGPRDGQYGFIVDDHNQPFVYVGGHRYEWDAGRGWYALSEE